MRLRHNTINVDRIHLKIAESNVVKRLLELVFDDTPHVSEYAEAGEKHTPIPDGDNTCCCGPAPSAVPLTLVVLCSDFVHGGARPEA